MYVLKYLCVFATRSMCHDDAVKIYWLTINVDEVKKLPECLAVSGIIRNFARKKNVTFAT